MIRTPITGAESKKGEANKLRSHDDGAHLFISIARRNRILRRRMTHGRKMRYVCECESSCFGTNCSNVYNMMRDLDSLRKNIAFFLSM